MQPTRTKPDQSVPEQRLVARDRRRCVRQKVHSSAVASMDGSTIGTLVDLNEILDISEGGICLRNSAGMEVGQRFALRLDLAETKCSLPATAQVVWSKPSGHTGVRFDQMPRSSHRQLKE